MSPKLRPLILPAMVEAQRRKEEAMQNGLIENESQCPFTTFDPYSSDATSPTTPTSSPRGHLRYSSSVSSFDITTLTCSDSPSSPKQAAQTSSKRILDDVKEEPIEYADVEDIDDAEEDGDNAFNYFDLYDCLCDEPCIHRDAELVQSTSNLYASHRDAEYDAGCLSDSEYSLSPLSLRKKSTSDSMPPFMNFSYRVSSRFATWGRWRTPKKSGSISSPVSSDFGFGRRDMSSRAASSRSSSLSVTGRHRPDRTNEPPLPPTPALSFYGSSDSITMPGPLDVEETDSVLASLQRERAQATTPLLPPLMTSSTSEKITTQPSPLESPTIASMVNVEPISPLILSPPLSTKPSISSFRHLQHSAEPLPIPEQDAWSDRLGHANFTILPKPSKPVVMTLASLRQLRNNWDLARINYTKHLARTAEHYGGTSKTFAWTQDKWAETDTLWSSLYNEVLDTVIASGEASECENFGEGILFTVPRMDVEGKFPERGDEDIVGPMIREATMTPVDGNDRKRPGFWRSFSERVGLKK